MPIEMIEHWEAMQTSLTHLLELCVRLFVILGCTTLFAWLAGIVWLSYSEAQQPRSNPAARDTT